MTNGQELRKVTIHFPLMSVQCIYIVTTDVKYVVYLISAYASRMS